MPVRRQSNRENRWQHESETSSSGEDTSEEEQPRKRVGKPSTSKEAPAKAPRSRQNPASRSSQGATTSGSQAQLDQSQLKRLTSDMVKFLLISNQKKHAVKRANIIKYVLKEYAKHFKLVLNKAKEELSKVFGIEVVELEAKKNAYILVNTIDTNSDDTHLNWTKADNAKFGLLTVILTIIFMNGNKITDGELWQALKKLGLDQEESLHDNFDDLNKLIYKEFARQLYLDITRIPNSEPPAFELEWGPRALGEVSKKDLLDFVCQIYGNIKPAEWVSQYEDAAVA